MFAKMQSNWDSQMYTAQQLWKTVTCTDSEGVYILSTSYILNRKCVHYVHQKTCINKDVYSNATCNRKKLEIAKYSSKVGIFITYINIFITYNFYGNKQLLHATTQMTLIDLFSRKRQAEKNLSCMNPQVKLKSRQNEPMVLKVKGMVVCWEVDDDWEQLVFYLGDFNDQEMA